VVILVLCFHDCYKVCRLVKLSLQSQKLMQLCIQKRLKVMLPKRIVSIYMSHEFKNIQSLFYYFFSYICLLAAWIFLPLFLFCCWDFFNILLLEYFYFVYIYVKGTYEDI